MNHGKKTKTLMQKRGEDSSKPTREHSHKRSRLQPRPPPQEKKRDTEEDDDAYNLDQLPLLERPGITTHHHREKIVPAAQSNREEALSAVAAAWGLVDDGSDNDDKDDATIPTPITTTAGKPQDLLKARMQKDESKRKREREQSTSELRSWDPIGDDDTTTLTKTSTMAKKKIMSVIDQAAARYMDIHPAAIAAEATTTTTLKPHKSKHQ